MDESGRPLKCEIKRGRNVYSMHFNDFKVIVGAVTFLKYLVAAILLAFL